MRDDAAMFIDQVRVHVRGGDGGDGVTAFSRQPFEPLGPPSGGDGGTGGSVVLAADTNIATLIDYHHSPKRKAPNGGQGAGAYGGNPRERTAEALPEPAPPPPPATPSPPVPPDPRRRAVTPHMDSETDPLADTRRSSRRPADAGHLAQSWKRAPSGVCARAEPALADSAPAH